MTGAASNFIGAADAEKSAVAGIFGDIQWVL